MTIRRKQYNADAGETVSVLSMAKQVIDGDGYSVEFKNLMKAIALYYAAAKVL